MNTRLKNTLDVEDFPQGKIPYNSVFNIISSNVADYTHCIHKFPSKFIPQVPRWGILRYTKPGEKVLDPFCGSGTTLVEARLLNRNSYGLDIDPLSKLITKVKFTPLNISKLDREAKRILEDIKSTNRMFKLPQIPNMQHWFTETAARDLSIIKHFVYEIDNEDIRDFFKICFSSIIRKSSNADDQSQKTYVSRKVIKKPSPPKLLFEKILTRYVDAMKLYVKNCAKNVISKIIEYDAKDIKVSEISKKNKHPIDLAITSPPYITAVDYMLVMKLEYYWLDLIKPFDFLTFKAKYIGTDRFNVNQYKELQKTDNLKLDKLLKRIYNKDRKKAYIVYRYFEDMGKNIETIYKILKKKGHYCIVVGNNMVVGINIPMHEILIDCGKKVGFKLENVFSYNIKNHFMRFPRQGKGGFIKVDWIVDLVKY